MKNKLVFGLLVIFLICCGAEAIGGMLTAKSTAVSEIVSHSLPRGRGNGRGAGKAFWWGLFGILPFVALVAAPFAYYHGIRNATGIRKYKGAAIAGMILVTFGVVFTIAILTV